MKAKVPPHEREALWRKMSEGVDAEHLTREEVVFDAWMNFRHIFGDRADPLLHCHASPSLRAAAGGGTEGDWPELEVDWWWSTNEGLRCEMPRMPLLRPGTHEVDRVYWCWACHFVRGDIDWHGGDGPGYYNGRVRVPAEFQDDWEWLDVMAWQPYTLEGFEHHQQACQAAPIFWENKRRIDFDYYNTKSEAVLKYEIEDYNFALAHTDPEDGEEAVQRYTQLSTAIEILTYLRNDLRKLASGHKPEAVA